MTDAHHCSGPPVSQMTYTVSSGTLSSTLLLYYTQSKFIVYTIYRKTSDRSPRLLSVQVNQTPACMRGPASIQGPACIITCQVYRQLSCLPGTSILFIFTLKHRILRCKKGYKVYYIP